MVEVKLRARAWSGAHRDFIRLLGQDGDTTDKVDNGEGRYDSVNRTAKRRSGGSGALLAKLKGR